MQANHPAMDPRAVGPQTEDPAARDPRILDANAPADGRVRIPGSNRFTRIRDLRFSRKAGIAVLLVFSTFTALVAILAMFGTISSHVSSALLWALLGLYFAFAILIIMYRMVSRLE